MSSTAELFEQERRELEAFKNSGESEKFQRGLEDRIALVIDSAQGYRRFRNLWGLMPVKIQEMLFYRQSDGPWPSDIKVGGKRFDHGLSAAENLIDEVIYKMTNGQVLTPYFKEKEESFTIHTSGIVVPELGIKFERAEYHFLPRPYKDKRRVEFIPGYDSLVGTRWEVVFSSPEEKYSHEQQA